MFQSPNTCVNKPTFSLISLQSVYEKQPESESARILATSTLTFLLKNWAWLRLNDSNCDKAALVKILIVAVSKYLSDKDFFIKIKFFHDYFSAIFLCKYSDCYDSSLENISAKTIVIFDYLLKASIWKENVVLFKLFIKKNTKHYLKQN